jgi:putative FmdB family regulatory protein
MPTYEYACTECGERTEVVRSILDEPMTTCTVCGGALRKVFSPVGIVFKGSGFYRTDSRGRPSTSKADGGDKDKSKKAADNSSASKSSSSDGGSSSSTTKAAEKSA